MQLGTAGVPLDLAEAGDFEAIFSQMAATGQTLIMPMSVYQEFPEYLSTNLEPAFFPPPFGTADAAFYDLMREYGIKIVVPADVVYPRGSDLPPPESDPLAALINAAGSDIVAGVYTYDEPAKSGVSLESLQAVYEHVKSIDPDLPVFQVNAPLEPDIDAEAYLDAVAAAAQWADYVGFSVYPHGPLAGSVTPYSSELLQDPVQVVSDYMGWLEENLPDKLKIGVLQGFGLADLYSDSMLEEFDPAVVEAAAAPDIVEMSEMARALGGADMLMWFGASYQSSSTDPVWQDILDVSASLETDTQAGVGSILDADASANIVSEDADVGTEIGIRLALDSEPAQSPTFSVSDERFDVAPDGTLFLAAPDSLDFESESEIGLTVVARFNDGRVTTTELTLNVQDEMELITGTSGAEELVGTENAEYIRAEGGPDWLWGLGGNDHLEGGGGDDVLLGGAGDDMLSGGSGSDAMAGGIGNDQLWGGTGADMFVFWSDDGSDTVHDFSVGEDLLVFREGQGPGLRTSASGDDTVVQYGATSILLVGVEPDEIADSDILFA